MIAERPVTGRWIPFVSSAVALLFVAAAVIAPLLPDEMYYWDWSRHPAAGYFDHPRMIAASIALGTWFGGDTAFGVRLLPLLFGALTILALGSSARLIGGVEARRRLWLIVFGMPLITASFLLATPDAPFLAASAIAFWASIHAFRATTRFDHATWWMASGAFVGLGLQSKYTAFLLAFAMGIGLLCHRSLRPVLRTLGPWLGLVMAAIVAGPMLRWNAAHQWVSIEFQMLHGLGAATGGNSALRELSFLGGQLAIVNPIVLPLLVMALLWGARRATDPAESFLALVALVVFGLFVISASRRPVEANWTTVAYLPAVILLATTPLSVRAERWLSIGAGLGMGLTVIALVHVITPVLPLAREVDQLAESYGWEGVSRAVEGVQREPTANSVHTFVAGNRYQETAALAFHLADHPAVLSLNVDYRPNQYDFWPRFEQRAQPGDRIIFVIEPGAKADSVIDRLRPSFDSVRMVEELKRFRGNRELSPRDLWLLWGWKGTTLPRGLRP